MNRNNAELTAVYDALAEDVNFQGMCGARVTQSKVGDYSASYEGQSLGQMSKKQEKSIDNLSASRAEINPIADDKALQYAEAIDRVVQAIKTQKFVPL